MPDPTASQTVGPYLLIGLEWLNNPQVAAPGCPGEHVTIKGRVLDGDGKGINDAMVEIWQADSHGKYDHPEDTQPGTITPGFHGFGRMPTESDGSFHFKTIKPGPVADIDGGKQAPHIMVSVFMRGLLKRTVSRIYFPDEPMNATDRVLRSVPAERRATLIARREAGNTLIWDIHMQGDNETVIFDC